MSTQPRTPVIVVMGHIDHGKSSLLDFIRKSNVVAREAGGITQHVSAYEAVHEKEGVKRQLTFLDTPGHEAFRAMRARSAQAADIAILIVSAEDGVKPQTKEALEWILNRGIPYVVAINKIDKPGANIDKTKQSLAESGVYVEGWGGQIPWVAISAKTGEGIPELLDTLLLIADLSDIKGDAHAPAEGIIIEANRDSKKGVWASAIVRNGTLSKGSFVVAGSAFAPLRIIEDFQGKSSESIPMGSPVRIVGWNTVPEIGKSFSVCETKKEAEEKTALYLSTHESTDTLIDTSKDILPLVVKADTAGSLEALVYEIGKMTHERIALKIVGKGIGPVNEGDVKLASATKGTVIIGLHVKADSSALSLADRLEVPIELSSIIYKLTEWLEEKFKDAAPTIEIEEESGACKVLKCFSKNKDKQVLGGRVERGALTKNATVKIMRRDNEIGRGKVKELQSMKQIMDSVSEGTEFGALIEARTEIAPGDQLIAFSVVTTK